MGKFFHKSKTRPQKATKEELVDPVLYIGGLDPKKYPSLTDRDINENEQEEENPLNKR